MFFVYKKFLTRLHSFVIAKGEGETAIDENNRPFHLNPLFLVNNVSRCKYTKDFRIKKSKRKKIEVRG